MSFAQVIELLYCKGLMDIDQVLENEVGGQRMQDQNTSHGSGLYRVS
jgi:hypothetical protein